MTLSNMLAFSQHTLESSSVPNTKMKKPWGKAGSTLNITSQKF